jgi:hypothetical protein
LSSSKKIVERSSEAAAQPAKSAATLAVYFTDEAGQRYRVYDTTFTKGKHRQHPIGDPTATDRIFVPPVKEEMLRSYRFKKGESRVLEARVLARQLRDSEYAPREKPDVTHLKPW